MILRVTPMKTRYLAALMALCCPTLSFAFDKPAAWGPGTSGSFPVVPVFSCPNHFATAFPGFLWNNIRGHALAAANEWFVHGNADVRLRVQPTDLPATDSRCSSGSGTTAAGQVLLTAETNFGAAGVCRWASTFGGPGGAKLILHRGCVSASGTFSNLDWATNAEFPGNQQGDFWAVLLHEFGHVLGFNHASDATAVMFPSLVGLGENSQRNLSRDEILGLQDARAPYGSTQTTSLHRRAAASGPGTAAGAWLDEGEPTSVQMLGAPAVSRATHFNAASFYLMAFVRASDSALMWGRTDGVSNWTPGFAPIVATVSRHPPAIAGDAASPREVLAYVNDSQIDEIVFRTSSTGATWNPPMTLMGESSHVGPALAYLASRSAYVMAWPHSATGRIRTALSFDHGVTFANVQEWPTARTYHRLGITCPASDQCLLGYSDGSRPYTQWSILPLNFVPGLPGVPINLFAPGPSGTLGQDSYGGGLQNSAAQLQFGWRDRGTATILVSARRGINGNVNLLGFIQSVSDSAPTVSFDPTGANFALWSTYSSRYDQ
jgi:Matrixin